PPVASPSMVVICLPSAALTGSEHERVATPSTWTVQAPHWAMPQPYLVPVRPTCSRNTHNSGVSGSTSTLCDCPLTVKRAMRMSPVGRLCCGSDAGNLQPRGCGQDGQPGAILVRQFSPGE